MLIGIVNVDGYNCDIFKPIGYDPIFIHLDYFQPEINAAQAANPNTVSSTFLSKIYKIYNENSIKVLD